ncbi:Na+/H+ antiporter subunit E [Alcaligenaceae bacterium CGII-47]|nr:Na+/H+ antiporter subunit E [Alcaligenaceae bacterium CGII-47]
MKAFLRFLPLPCLLLILWVILNDSLSIGTLVSGGVIALILSLLAPSLRPVRATLSHPLIALRLIWHVFTDIVRSNVAVSRRIFLGERAGATPGFLDIPLQLRDSHGLAALACIITFTPGTVWAGYDESQHVLTLHVLDLKDTAAWRHTIQHRYGQPLMEIFE